VERRGGAGCRPVGRIGAARPAAQKELAMAIHTYLSLVPESLVLSMLPPAQFGTYLAVGTKKRSRGHSIYFNLKEGFSSDFFDLSRAAAHCTPHPDGKPKHTVYAAVYRVLEHVPLDALGSLWLVTYDGRVLELTASREVPALGGQYHLYQEICPVHPMVASTLAPDEFCRMMTDPGHAIHVPRICVADLELGELASDPLNGRADDLPYARIGHLRDALLELNERTGKHNKTVDRTPLPQFPYRVIRSGFYVGDTTGVLCYRFPIAEQLDRDHHDWWRSANV